MRRGTVLSVAAALVWLAAAAVIAWSLGTLLTDPSRLQPLVMAGGFAALALLRSLLEAAAQRALARAADARIAALRDGITRAEAAAATPSAHGGAGALAALAAEKLEAVRPYLLRYRPARMRASVLPLVILAIAAWHSWAVAVVLLLAGPLIPVFMALVGWAAKSASEEQMAEIGQLSDLLVDRLAALSDLRLVGAGPQTVDSFARASEDLRHRTMAVLRIAFLSSTVLELFSALGVAMVAIWVGFSLLGELGWGAWGAELSPAVGIYLLLLAPEFFQPLRDLAAAWHDRAAAEAVLDEIDAWRAEDRPQRMGHGTQAAPLAPLPVVQLQGVSRGAIRFPDLRVAPGETVALTGPSGCGKTTLLRLLAGLERPDTGRILLDGRVLEDDTADAWRATLGWMPQAPHFGNRSLRHNIGFGAPLDPALIETARLSEVLASLPRGDLTRLGERGAGLSGGEARRVTLARALHGRPGLILADEPTADLDAATAHAITDGLMRYVRDGGTLILATHDPALAARMDRQVALGTAEAAA
ncbi:cysteine ABC transporter permease [Pseudoponticoccus marisrubri]|uniref:Cysteine ABC transporter permease n=2 Tax=Pseudoponticoccus marisrubri TaxID=1685382 RepID=A0A0W7WFL0_9RHOB|nr:cysteine ABC transporter permease [Pseudoponticoccus marisrubri]